MSLMMPAFLKKNLPTNLQLPRSWIKFQESTASKIALNSERPGFLPGPVEDLSVN